MSIPEDRPLDPEQEALVAEFSAQLERTTGAKIEVDEDDVVWLTVGEFAVKLTPDQYDEFAEAIYQAALQRVYTLHEQAKPKSEGRLSKFAQVVLAGAALAVVVAGAAALVRSILGL